LIHSDFAADIKVTSLLMVGRTDLGAAEFNGTGSQVHEDLFE